MTTNVRSCRWPVTQRQRRPIFALQARGFSELDGMFGSVSPYGRTSSAWRARARPRQLRVW